MKNEIGHNIGSTPKKLLNDSFFTAVNNGFSSELVHAKHKAQQAAGLKASYLKMGFTSKEADAIIAGE